MTKRRIRALREKFVLITGRTTKQAIGMHKGKESEAYIRAVTRVDMSDHDMDRLGINEGEDILLYTLEDSIEVPVFKGNLPESMLFMPMGPVANRLVGVDTSGKGMPSYKGFLVEVERP